MIKILLFKNLSFLIATAFLFTGIQLSAQITLISDFDSNDELSVSTSGGSLLSGGASFPSGGQYGNGGDGFVVNNGTGTITTTSQNSAALSTFSFDLASLAGTSGNGADGSDAVTLEISTDGGSNYTTIVTINGNSNARWTYTGGGSVNTPYASPVTTAPAGGIAEITVVDIPAGDIVARITMVNNATAEYWAVDNLTLILSNTLSVGFDTAISSETETTASFMVDIPITLSNYGGSQVNLNIAVTGGTAEASDYTLNTPSLSFTADGTLNVSLSIHDDVDINNETIILTLTETTATGVSILTAVHQVNIIDDDNPAVAIFCENFEDEAVGASTGVSAEGITWSSTCPDCLSGDVFEVVAGNAFKGNDTNGPATWVTNTITGLDAYEVLVIELDFFGDDYAGSGNLETPSECGSVGGGCAGDVTMPTAGSCDNCWDFLYLDADFGAIQVQSLLLGDGAATGGTVSSVLCDPVNGLPSSGTISLIMSMWASAEDMSFDNIKMTGYTTLADAQAAGVTTVSCSILPIELLYFSGNQTPKGNLLNWETASEKDNDFFLLERSADGKSFETIEQISGNGTTTDLLEYSYLDARPLKGANYYRLKQVDYDGNYSFSDVVFINYLHDIKVSIRPNLVSQTMIMELAEMHEFDVPVEIFNLQGRLVFKNQVKAGDNSANFDLSELNPGQYFLKTNQNGAITMIRFIKM